MSQSPSPSELAQYFGADYPLMARFAAMLAAEGIEWGMIGPREADRIWSRHILNCAALHEVAPNEGDLLDLGSGAGLPGVVLAIQRPKQLIHLLEPLERRQRWLRHVVEELGLPNVRLIAAKAQQVAGTLSVAAVVTRAVAPLDNLLEWSAPLLAGGGQLLALKGAKAAAEVEAVRPAQRKRWQWPPTINQITTIPNIQPSTIVRISREMANRC